MQQRPHYRSMRRDPDGLPTVGCRSFELGVRPGYDLPVVDGHVEPKTGGMSVVDEVTRLHPFARPASLGGQGRHPVYVVGELTSDQLSVRWDGGHGLVEPAVTCPLEQYQGDLAATRSRWRRVA
jgi:hypothetical protein